MESAGVTAPPLRSTARVPTLARPTPAGTRNRVWLAGLLDRLWEEHFWDVPRVAPVEIRFGSRWKRRLGLIRWESDTESTLIALNGRFRDLIIPLYVIESTVAHELVHYAQGFGSPLPRRLADPHADDVIERELVARGLGRELELADDWIADYWETLDDQSGTG